MKAIHLFFMAMFYCGCLVDIPALAGDSENGRATDSATSAGEDTSPGKGSDSGEGTETETDSDAYPEDDSETGAGDTSEQDSATATETDIDTSNEADFEQSNDQNGLVIIEAENFSSRREGSANSSWQKASEPDDYFGTGAMKASPAGYLDHTELTFAKENAPVLEYTVNFIKAHPVYVWGRASHVGGLDDSVWIGVDGEIEGTLPLCFLEDEQEPVREWYYIRYLMDESRATIDVDQVGIKTFELYMREPGFSIDRIILTTNPDYTPEE